MLVWLVLFGVACEPTKEPVPAPETQIPALNVTVKSVEGQSATLVISTTLATDYAYVISDDPSVVAMPSEDLFSTGKRGTITSAATELVIEGLNFDTSYKVFLVAKYEMDNPDTDIVENPEELEFSDVYELTLATQKIDSVIEILPSTNSTISFKINVAAGDTIGVRALSFHEYQLWRNLGLTDALILGGELASGDRSYYTETQVVEFVGWESYETGAVVGLNPREMVRLVVGEVEVEFNEYAGGEMMTALFDLNGYNSVANPNEDDYWLTEYHAVELTAVLPPAESSSKVDVVEVSSTISSATFKLTPDPAIKSYNHIFVTEGEWDLLNEWFGYEGALYWCEHYSQELTEPTEITVQPLDQDRGYKLVVQGREDSDGMVQSTAVVDFKAGVATKGAPEFVVTPIAIEGVAAPWEVAFNIKCTTNDASSVIFLCNEATEWDNALYQGIEYSTILLDYGTPETATDVISAVNSAEGYDIIFGTWESTTSRLVVMGQNDEGTYNDPDLSGSTAVAESTSARIQDAERVESPLFDELAGNWLAKAYIFESEMNGTVHSYVKAENPIYSQVVIGSSTPYSSSTPSALYSKYSHLSDEEVDVLFEEFKQGAEDFAGKVRGQNRVLGTGLDFSTIEDAPTVYISPEEALLSESYPTSYRPSDIYYDFGPKWYLQIDQSGEITLPISNRFVTPLINMPNNRINQYGVETVNGAYHFGVQRFNVTISEDRDTLTVHPVEFQNSTYYYTAAYPWSGFDIITPAFVCAELQFIRNGEVPAGESLGAPSMKYYQLPTGPAHSYTKKHHMTRFNKVDLPAVYTSITVAPTSITQE